MSRLKAIVRVSPYLLLTALGLNCLGYAIVGYLWADGRIANASAHAVFFVTKGIFALIICMALVIVVAWLILRQARNRPTSPDLQS